MNWPYCIGLIVPGRRKSRVTFKAVWRGSGLCRPSSAFAWLVRPRRNTIPRTKTQAVLIGLAPCRIGDREEDTLAHREGAGQRATPRPTLFSTVKHWATGPECRCHTPGSRL